jgi:tyrosinase
VIVADVVLRPEVDQADIAALRDAYGKMQALSATDNRSWIYWSEFHGFDRYDCWHHYRVGPGRGTQFAYDLFLPWHRAYLASFDHAARDQNEDAVLPWWDWTSEASHQVGIPPGYAEPEVDGQVNPLASGPTPDMPDDPARRTRRFPYPPSWLPSMDEPRPELGLQLSVNEVLDLPQFVDFSAQLQDVHDYIHGWAGGINPDDPDDGGDMGNIGTSAFDPLFWAHHAMIDRLWYLWQLRWGTNNIPTDYMTKVLAPFPFTVRDVLDINELGYEYAVASAVTVTAREHAHGEGP